MPKKQVTIEHLDASISRWKTRLRRAVNMIDKLEKQRKRLAVRASVPAHPTVDSETTLGTVPPRAKPARGPSDEPAPEKSSTSSAPVPPAPVALVERKFTGPGHLEQTGYTAPDDDIPSFLRRQTAPSPVAEAIRQEQAETKRLKAKGRIAKMKAKKAGDLKKMPLTGKAALAAIRGQ